MSNDSKNLFMAIILSIAIILGWQYFYEAPRTRMRIESQKAAQAQLNDNLQLAQAQSPSQTQELTQENSDQAEAGEIKIDTPSLSGSISLRGLRFQALELKKYKQTINPDSPLIELFSTSNNNNYFAEFGWVGNETNTAIPNKNTIWHCDSETLEANKLVHCNWFSSTGVHFQFVISVDENYLFKIRQTVTNNSDTKINIANYGRIYKAYGKEKEFAIIHEGAIGVFSGVLEEQTYEELSKEKRKEFTNSTGSWAGFTDKYWLSALAPDAEIASKTNFIASPSTDSINPHDVFNINYITEDTVLTRGKRLKAVNYLFAGAKEDKLLSQYEEEYHFELFDRSIDFGIFYFITKPLFWLISTFYNLLGNFGLAIIAVTLTIKLIMYPLANKSYASMAKMKELQPKLELIKKNCGDDKMRLNTEVMELYKREKVNPAAGCLPILIQIPVFFSLYKVIFISIEMRHAPFYGWIKDLSAPDPTSIFNLFGLLPWEGFINVGAWPVIMAITMFIQQKLGPEPTDPVQGTVMKLMPLILLVMLYSLPSGLMIYWSFSNILSIIQQYAITKTHKK